MKTNGTKWAGLKILWLSAFVGSNPTSRIFIREIMKKTTCVEDLLKSINPKLVEGKYFFARVSESQLFSLAGLLRDILCVFREEEGLAIVFSEEVKNQVASLSDEKIVGPFALISLTVKSDLFAVGFLARVTNALAKEKISANAFSAYSHDHLLVPFDKKEAALNALKKLRSRD